MRTKNELQDHVLFLYNILSNTTNDWEKEMLEAILEDTQDKLDVTNGVVPSSLNKLKSNHFLKKMDEQMGMED